MVVLSNCNDLLRSGSYFRKVPVPVPAPFPALFPILAQFPVPAPFFSVLAPFSDTALVPVPYLIQTYLAQFFNNKNSYKILPFQCKKQHFFQKGGLYFKFFDFCITFILDPGPNPIPVQLRQKVAVPSVTVPAPVPQHCPMDIGI
jgi:hypothetical protein